jgi:hypothetical protein
VGRDTAHDAQGDHAAVGSGENLAVRGAHGPPPCSTNGGTWFKATKR